MLVWELPVQELQVQRLLVLVLVRLQERSTQQGQRQHLVQRAWVLVQASQALHQVQAGFHGFQSMKSPSARRAHFSFAAHPI